METKHVEEVAKEDCEIKKGKVHIIPELIEYKNAAVISKSILEKTTRSIVVLAFVRGEDFSQKSAPFDRYVQIIDGNAIIEVDEKVSTLQTGQGIIIPALKSSHIKSDGRCKLILTTIKSAYN